MPTFVLVTDVDAPPERVFDLARSVDLHTASMEDHGEQAVAGVTEGLLEKGDQVTWRARHFGVPFSMTVEIADFDRPRYFRDVQVSGPFGELEHEHVFEPADGATRMRDRFSFSSPLGPIGAIADRIVLGRYLRRLVRARLDHLQAVAESDRWRAYLDGPT